jgi:hypothetical protein
VRRSSQGKAIAFVLTILATLAADQVARAADPDAKQEAPKTQGPEVNPYECYGGYQAATENRTIGEMRHELAQRMAWLNTEQMPPTIRAVKLCIIAKLKARVGDSDAWDYFEQSLAADPNEPGLELWAGQYWSGNRGARRPIAEKAEDHYYAALEKLDRLEREGRMREYHYIVKDWVHRELTVLYQMDGLPLLPWKAYPQHASGHYAPGVSISSQLRVAKDTRDFFFNNEYRQFTAEKNFAASAVRFGGTQNFDPNGKLNQQQISDLARAPLRLQVDNDLRIRHNLLGTFDVIHSYLYQWKSQVYDFYDPTHYFHPDLPQFSDIQVQQFGGAYERVFPLYPLFDLRLAAGFRKVWRDGIVEFYPHKVQGIDERRETLNLYEFKPSISRFLGADKLTLNGVYALLDISGTIGAPSLEQLRRKVIRAASLEYGIYQPLVLPTFAAGGISTYRTPTRGLYVFGGLADDGEAYGSHQVVARDIYGGIRFEGPDWTDFWIQGTYGTNNTVYGATDGRGNGVFSEADQAFKYFRTTLILQRRIRSWDTFPGMPPSTLGFGSDMFNVVLPISWDKTLSGGNDYENVRGGLQIWTKLIGEGLWGTSFLITAGGDYQYFYHLKKGIPMFQTAIRMGWGDL